MPLRLFALLVSATAALAQDAGDGRVFESWQLALALPDGWSLADAPGGDAPFHVELRPDDDRPLKLAVQARAGGPGSELSLLQQTLEYVEAGDYERPRECAFEFGELELPGFELEVDTDGESYLLSRGYLQRSGLVYVFEVVVLERERRRHADAVAEVWSGIAFLEPGEERLRELGLRAQAGRCGTALDWAPGWGVAAELARDRGTLVLVHLDRQRGFDIPDEAKRSVFTDPDVIELVRERYVPFELRELGSVPFASPERYGLSKTTFGVACLLVTPDGDVVAEQRLPGYRFLREHARGGDEPADDLPALERASALIARGEHDAASELLEGEESAAALGMLADVARRERRGPDALALLDRARVAPGGEALAADLGADRLRVLLGLGRQREAVELARDLLEDHPAHARAPEVRFRLGETERALGNREAAEAVLTELCDELPEDPWAAQAAALLMHPMWEIAERWDRRWPDEALVELMTPKVFEPLPRSRAAQALDDAVAWLLDRQVTDGSWPTRYLLRERGAKPPDDIHVGTASFAVRALLAVREDVRGERRQRLEASVAAGVEFLRRACEAHRDDDSPVFYMDYMVWTHSCWLEAFAAAHEAGLLERAELEELGGWCVEELLRRQTPAGGWSYYLSGDLDSGVTEATVPFSFVTATVLLALERARDAGLEVSDDVLARGVESLAAQRSGVHFGYSSLERDPGALPGAAGRGPLCMLALLRQGAAAEDELEDALESYLDHAHTLTAELGKVLMHAGPHGQGSHYVLYDLHWAGRAALELPRAKRESIAKRVLDELLAARTADGSFLDFPIVGPSFGTAVAVGVLASLGV